MNNSRRIFLMAVLANGTAIGGTALAQTRLDEKDPQAVALGYTANATKADIKRFPKYAPGQACNNCALFQGKATDVAGGCPLFAGRQVTSTGWCSAWAKKG